MGTHDLFWQVTASGAGATYDLSRDLTSVLIEEEDRAPSRCTIQLPDAHQLFSHAFREGMDVEADLGSVEDHGVVFRGRIYHVDATMPQDGMPTVTVKAYDPCMELGLKPRNRRFVDVTLEQIIRQLVNGRFTGSPAVDLLANPKFEGQGLRQREETDLCFLRRLAAANHCTMGVDVAGTFRFKATAKVLKEQPTVSLAYGRCDVPARLLTFQAQADAGRIEVARVIAALDPITGEVHDVRESPVEPPVTPEDPLLDEALAAFAVESADRASSLNQLIAAAPAVDTTFRKSLGAARRAPIPTFSTLDQLAEDGALQPGATALGMEANGGALGNKAMHVGAPLMIVGGGRFSGPWFVTKATHTLDRQGYRTDFTCER
jgi:hypothetical protein